MKKLFIYCEQNNIKINPVKFTFNGKVAYKGFDLIKNDKCVTIEPQDKGIKFVSFANYKHICQHYSRKINGFYPALCRPLNFMIPEIIEYFEN